VALVGLSGAGKSAVGPLLASRLERAFEDLDDRVLRDTGRGVAEILRVEGEAAFRRVEREALRRVLLPARDDAAQVPAPVMIVLACGGGIVTDPASRALLDAGATVVWLTVRPETALERLGAAGVAARPLLAGSVGAGGFVGTGANAGALDAPAALAKLQALEAARNPLYGSIAALTVPTDGRTPEDVADEAAAALRTRWASSAS
jgi:shikimate kinase